MDEERNYVEAPQAEATQPVAPVRPQSSMLPATEKWIKYSQWISQNPQVMMDPTSRAAFTTIGQNLKAQSSLAESAAIRAAADQRRLEEEAQKRESETVWALRVKEANKYAAEMPHSAYLQAIKLNGGNPNIVNPEAMEFVFNHRDTVLAAKAAKEEENRKAALYDSWQQADAELKSLKINKDKLGIDAEKVIATQQAKAEGLAQAAGVAVDYGSLTEPVMRISKDPQTQRAVFSK